ncbi:MAG: hypothetical protein OEX04_15975, partial [Acidimicrobiia bacterium]|nr:hypothetical protein [Acidimicrobiia bacterium]
SLDGEPIADGVLGTWTFERAGSGVRVVPPVGLGLAPELESLTVVAFGRTPVAIQAWLTASAEVRVLARTSTGLVELTEWEVEDAGPIRWFWGAGFPTAPGSVLIVQARSPDGADEASVAFVAGAE